MFCSKTDKYSMSELVRSDRLGKTCIIGERNEQRNCSSHLLLLTEISSEPFVILNRCPSSSLLLKIY